MLYDTIMIVRRWTNLEGQAPSRRRRCHSDAYTVKVAGEVYRPNVIVRHGEWYQLRWREEGRYLPNDVWVPRNAILAIEENHK